MFNQILVNSPVSVNVPTYGFAPTSADKDAVSSADDEEIKRLRSCNALWDKYKEQWKLYVAAYEGGIEFTTADNLFKHQRENTEDYEDRLARLHNLNYCEPLVDFYTNFIFSEPIERNGGTQADWYNDFVSNVNKKKDSIDAFMRQVSDDNQIFGMSYVLVDAPPKEPSIVTKQQEQENGISPYWVLIKAPEIIDWVTDDFGFIVYAKRQQKVAELVGNRVAQVERYTEFFPDRTVITGVDVSKAGKPQLLPAIKYANTLGRVPLVILRHKLSKIDPYVGVSFLRDFAGNNREIMNQTSLLQEFLYRQAFNILAKEVEISIPYAEQEQGTLGTSNVLEYPKGATKPEYISPPVDPAKFIQAERASLKHEMFLRASQDALQELFNGEKSSGFSKAQSFAKTVPFISSRADILEAAENELMDLTMQMVSKTWDGKIKYKDRYELTNLTDALTQFLIIVRDLALPAPTFVKEELKRLTREFDSKLPKDVIIQIEKEIDDMDFTTWSETQKLALVGNSGNSPGDQQKSKSTGTMAEAAKEAKAPNVAATKKVKT